MSDPRNLHMGVAEQSHHKEYNLSGNATFNQHYGAVYNQTIHTPHTAQPNRHTIPRCPAPCPNYTHREAIENHIHSYFLTRCLGMKCYVLHGPGGTGKTEIGLASVDAFCYSQEPDNRWFPDALWIDATTDETIRKSFKDIGVSIGVGPKIEDVLRWLASRSGHDANWITIFNNADDPKLDLTKYFPKCSHGNILITTRNYHARRYGVGPGSDYEVFEMTADEALTLFRKHARLFGDANPSLIETAKLLVEEVGKFALAVTQAGAFISTSQCSLSQYRDLYRDQRQELFRQYEEIPATYDYQYRSLHTTWIINYVTLSDPAKELFHVFGCVHYEDIKEDMFSIVYSGQMDRFESHYEALFTENEKTGFAKLKRLGKSLLTDGKWDFIKFRRLIRELQSYSLIVFDPERGTCSIHPLVHEWVGDICDMEEQSVLRQCAILLLGSSLVKLETTEELAFCRSLTPHVDRIFQGIEPHENTCGSRFGAVYRKAGRWEDALVHLELFKELCVRVLGEEHLHTIISVHGLTLIYTELGWFNDAENLQSQVVEALKKILGPEHPGTLVSMSNLAIIYLKLGWFDDAEKLQSQILETHKRILGPECPEMLSSMNNLALTYLGLGQFNDAEKLQSQALEAQKRVLGPEHPDTFASMNNLAAIHLRLGWFNNAEKLQSQVLEAQKRILGPEHPATLTSMSNLGLTYTELGRSNDAEKLQSQALEARKRLLGPEHPDTLASMDNLALAYVGRPNDAKNLQLQALEVRKRVLGPEHPDMLHSMNNLGLTYSELERFNDAEKLQSQVLEAEKTILGPEHPITLTSMGNLALTHLKLGQSSDAENLQLQVLEGRKRLLGPENPRTLTSAYYLAYIYQHQDKLAEAEELAEQTLAVSLRILGADHSDTIDINQLLSEIKQQRRHGRNWLTHFVFYSLCSCFPCIPHDSRS